MWLKVLYFCLIISSLTLGQDNPCARALGEKDPCARGVNSKRWWKTSNSRSDNNGINCHTCKVFGEIERRLQNRFETEMMQIKTQLANMNNIITILLTSTIIN